MARDERVAATNATSSRTGRAVGNRALSIFTWLTVGPGTSITFAAIGWITLGLWTGMNRGPEADFWLAVIFAFTCFLYLIIQTAALIFHLMSRGGSVLFGTADLGMALLPLVGPGVIVVATVLHAFEPTRTTFVVGGMIIASVALDFITGVLYMRATQKTFDTPEAAHPH